MSTGESVPPFLRGLVDDAAIFPPGLMPLPRAFDAHRAHASAGHAELVGPFVVDAARLPAVRHAAGPEPIEVSVVTSVDDASGLFEEVAGSAVRIAAVEAKLDTDAPVGDQLGLLARLAALHPGTRVFVEAPRPTSPHWTEVLTGVARGGLLLKFRTGGTDAEAFPSIAELTTWITAAVAAGVPFKATAGLHNAIRHTDTATGFDHHGYLNLLLATARALQGGDVAAALDLRDENDLVDSVRALDEASRIAVRHQFLSYGSCSIEEPWDDLTRLGLVGSRDTAPAAEVAERAAETWVPGAAGSLYDLDNLPYGLFRTPARSWRLGVRIGDAVLDLREAARRDEPSWMPLVAGSSLDALLDAGPQNWSAVRAWATTLLTEPQRDQDALIAPLDEVTLGMPFTIGDYVDFYASAHHAGNVGRIFRPDSDPILPNWSYMPVSYHGRAGSVGVSDTVVVRPRGQRKRPNEDAPTFGPSRQLDIEAELGFVVGRTTRPGQRVSTAEFARSVFGVVGLNDWSARDIQAWEYVPLGPHLGKSFATTISSWVTPLTALDAARTDLPGQNPAALPHLQVGPLAGYDIDVEVHINGELVSRPPYATMYWSPAQMLAHLTSNGAPLRPGDLFGSGTISGPERTQRGSLLELSWGGREPWREGPEPEGAFLLDGDEVVLRYTAPGARGRIALGEVRATIVAATSESA